MYRKDAGRTGATAAEPGDGWQLTWSRDLPPLTPAYHSGRLQFDAGYEPVVSQGRMVVASSKTDSVTAYDSSTGEQLWQFMTNGPVRLAPAIWDGSVCFGSDDGFLYCTDLATGKLRWKHRAVPSQRRLLGNRRLISVWPVRGGPVVADGRVYFAAGVWPFEGVFVYCMEIATGEVVWRNDRMGFLFGQQPHNTEAIGGLAPQGYLVINGDELIVPCSTAYPARLNRHTGELIEFELPGAGRLPGGWFAALDPDTSRALRRGSLTFDDVVNRQQHEDKVHKGKGVSGLSREIRVGELLYKFDAGFKGIPNIHSMLVADGFLYVVRKDGTISGYQRGTTPKARLENWILPDNKLDVAETASARAKSLVELAPTSHGVAIVLGLDDGAIVKALLENSWYQVIAIDDDPERVAKLRRELVAARAYGERASVLLSDLDNIALPPYIATLLTTERSDGDYTESLTSLRPFGGVATIGKVNLKTLRQLQPNNLFVSGPTDDLAVRRVGPLPGTTDYSGDWQASPDELVRFPLGVLWFDDTLAHFKRSPQPKFTGGTMISRPKDWHAPRGKGDNRKDYPLLAPVLSDIYTGRVLAESEMNALRSSLSEADPNTREPSQYRPPRQKDDWKPDQPIVGERTNPLTGALEPRSFPKTYGCDGGVDYGSFFTLRSGTAAYYDKTIESGTVFLSGPRSGCTNSIIPAGGLLNVPYFYDGCTCSYPLPTAMSLVAMPESFEQWSSWGATDLAPSTIQRIGVNFGAPGDRITKSGTLWLDYPAVGGPSPKIDIVTSPQKPTYHYRHSLWMHNQDPHPWVTASMAEGLGKFQLSNLKPGKYTVRLYFAEPEHNAPGKRVQSIKIQGKERLVDFDVFAETGNSMSGIAREFKDVEIDGALTIELTASKGRTIISGVEARLER